MYVVVGFVVMVKCLLACMNFRVLRISLYRYVALISSTHQLSLLRYRTRHLPCDISRKLHFEQEGDPNGGDTVTVRNAIDVTLWRLVPAKSAHLPF